MLFKSTRELQLRSPHLDRAKSQLCSDFVAKRKFTEYFCYREKNAQWKIALTFYLFCLFCLVLGSDLKVGGHLLRWFKFNVGEKALTLFIYHLRNICINSGSILVSTCSLLTGQKEVIGLR